MLRWLPPFLLLASHTALACEIHGKRASLRAHVAPDRRGPAFDVQVSDGPAAVQYGTVAMVHVSGGLAFDAPLAAPTQAMIGRRTVLAGVLTLPHGTAVLVRRAASPTTVDTRLELIDFTVEHLTVPCSALELDHLDGGSYRTSSQAVGPRVVPRSKHVSFRPAPDAPAGLAATLDDPADFVMRVLGRRGAWVHIAWSGPEAASLDAWLLDAEVAPVEPEARPDPDAGRGATPMPGRWARASQACNEASSGRPGALMATFAHDTPVYAVVGGKTWAKIASRDPVAVTVSPEAASWLALRYAGSTSGPSCSPMQYAWVPRAAATVHTP